MWLLLCHVIGALRSTLTPNASTDSGTVLGAVGGLAGALALLFLLIWIVRRKKRAEQNKVRA